ncbi:MAG: tetratricopeptide repeat-containing sensor histidine kinase [Bacteroidales bacterium]|nr:tetratricopeptide repeat-containing sensor histidine kinase [Bacteroidales bacterium]
MISILKSKQLSSFSLSSSKVNSLLSIFRNCILIFILSIPLISKGENEIDSLMNAFKQQSNPKDQISSLSALGKAYHNAADYRNALETDRKLLDLVSKYGTKIDSAQVLRHLGLVMMEMSWYDESLNYLMQAQQVYGEAGDYAKQATSLMNVGIVHDYLGNLPMSLAYYNKALSYFEKHKDEVGIANCKLNIGIVLTKQKKYEPACQHFLDAAAIYERTNNITSLASAYINLGLAYKNQKKYDLAMEYHKKSYDIFTSMNDKLRICFYHLNMGELLLQMDQIDASKPHLDEAKKLAESMASMQLKARAYEFLSDYYKHKRDFENAYNYLIKSKEINDSTLNAETVKKVSQIQYHYEIAKRESENVKLVKQNLQKELVLSQRNTTIYIMAAMLLLIVFLVVILLLWNRSKHNANLLLEAKNKLILSQKEELIKLNASKDKFLSVLAHDIKNPLSAILGVSDILKTDYEQLQESERKGFINDIFTSSSNLFDIVNTLLNWSISQNGMISYQPRDFNIGELSQNTMDKLQTIAKLKDVSLTMDEHDDISVFADDNMVMSVIHNLICNAIKYSHKGGTVYVRNLIKDGSALIGISDAGIGISPENQSKLFRYDQSFRSKGTSGESGTGIGLLLCKEFAERNNGKIWIESETGQGSTFWFTLPLSK